MSSKRIGAIAKARIEEAIALAFRRLDAETFAAVLGEIAEIESRARSLEAELKSERAFSEKLLTILRHQMTPSEEERDQSPEVTRSILRRHLDAVEARKRGEQDTVPRSG